MRETDKLSNTTLGELIAKLNNNFVQITGDNATNLGVTAMLGKLTDKVVKDTELKTKAAAKDVVDAITASSDFTNKVYIKAAPADEVYTKTAADTAFAKTDGSNISTQADKGKALADAILAVQDGKKSILVNKLGEALDRVANTADDKVYGAAGHEKIAKDFLADKYPFAKTDGSNIDKDFAGKVFDVTDGAAANPKNIAETKLGTTFAKINASNLTEAANKKAFADAILPAQDGKKSILVDKLEGFLGTSDKVYSNNTKTAKELLVPSAAEIAADPSFKVNVTEAKIKELVQEVMSQPSFDIPTSDDAALDWTW